MMNSPNSLPCQATTLV